MMKSTVFLKKQCFLFFFIFCFAFISNVLEFIVLIVMCYSNFLFVFFTLVLWPYYCTLLVFFYPITFKSHFIFYYDTLATSKTIEWRCFRYFPIFSLLSFLFLAVNLMHLIESYYLLLIRNRYKIFFFFLFAINFASLEKTFTLSINQ